MAVHPHKQRAPDLRQGARNLLERRLVHFLLIASLMTALALMLHAPRWGATEYLDHLALDQYFVLRGAPSPETVAQDLPHTKDIVLIETTHQIPRPILAKLLEKIRLAKVIAIDMMFVDSEAELEPEEKPLYREDIKAWRQDTDVLARKIKELGNVVVGAWPEQVRAVPTPSPVPVENAQPKENMQPAAIAQSTGPAELKEIWQRPAPALWRSAYNRAHFLVEPDHWDLVVRDVSLFKTIVFETRRDGRWIKSPPERIPSLGFAAAAAAAGISPQELQKLEVRDGMLRIGDRAIPVDANGMMLIDYVGGRQSFESDANHRNYLHVLTSEFYEPEDFKDKIIILGESSYKSKEIMDTPYGQMPGMQIHANVAATVLSRHGPPRPLPLWQTAALALICSLWLVVPLIRLPLWGSFIFAGLQVVLLIFLGAWLFSTFHAILPVSVPVIAIVLTYNAIALYEYRRARHTLGKFIGHEMVAQTMHIFSRPKLGGRLGIASAFFCDLRGYSSLPSLMSTEAVSGLVNSYTDTLVNVVKKHGGRPIDYQGDGVFILFEPSLAGQDFAVNAVRAALEMQQVFLELRQQWVEQGAPLMEIGIGIDTGTMMIGAVGSEQHLKMGAVGDPVNMAARVQGLNQECGYPVLVTHKTYEHVQHAVEASFCGAFPVRGREEPIEVYGIESVVTDQVVTDQKNTQRSSRSRATASRTAATGAAAIPDIQDAQQDLHSESKVASA